MSHNAHMSKPIVIFVTVSIDASDVCPHGTKRHTTDVFKYVCIYLVLNGQNHTKRQEGGRKGNCILPVLASLA